jgi:hypothetical protein
MRVAVADDAVILREDIARLLAKAVPTRRSQDAST